MTYLAAVQTHFKGQIAACLDLGSPFTAAILETLNTALPARRGAAERIANWPGDATADALALRAAGGLHALALTAQSPSLAQCYAAPDTGSLGRAIDNALVTHAGLLNAFLDHPPQTNEVGRSAILAGGFLTIAAETGLPLHIREIGASAGLNLLWDRWRYRLGGLSWGRSDAPVSLQPAWTGPAPPDADAVVASRRGCDLKPVDLSDEAACLRLRAYIWPDQPERLARIEAAIAEGQRLGLTVDATPADQWIAAQIEALGEPQAAASGSAPSDPAVRVLYHSIVWQYVEPAGQQALLRLIAQAGDNATREAPFAWLRMEPSTDGRVAEFRLALWPGGKERLLARTHYHGTWVEWSG